MVSDNLKREARKVWNEYGEAIKKAWSFPPTSRIVADGLEEVLATSTDDRVRAFIRYTRDQITEVQQMKFVGED